MKVVWAFRLRAMLCDLTNDVMFSLPSKWHFIFNFMIIKVINADYRKLRQYNKKKTRRSLLKKFLH